MKKLFRYIEPLWTGTDGRFSLRATLAIAFSIDFISNLSHAIYKWDAGRTLEGLSFVLGIEAGLIVALLGLTTYQNMQTLAAANKTSVEISTPTSGKGAAVKIETPASDKPKEEPNLE